jgi:hydrogenase-4 membrane subunit HyfE
MVLNGLKGIAMRALVGCWIPFALIPVRFLLATGPDIPGFAITCLAYAVFVIGLVVLVTRVSNRRTRVMGFALHGVYVAFEVVLWWGFLRSPS